MANVHGATSETLKPTEKIKINKHPDPDFDSSAPEDTQLVNTSWSYDSHSFLTVRLSQAYQTVRSSTILYKKEI